MAAAFNAAASTKAVNAGTYMDFLSAPVQDDPTSVPGLGTFKCYSRHAVYTRPSVLAQSHAMQGQLSPVSLHNTATH
jgi:hypothetical protein